MHCPGLEASVVAQQNPSRARPFGFLATFRDRQAFRDQWHNC